MIAAIAGVALLAADLVRTRPAAAIAGALLADVAAATELAGVDQGEDLELGDRRGDRARPRRPGRGPRARR